MTADSAVTPTVIVALFDNKGICSCAKFIYNLCMIVIFLISFLAITTQSSVLHYNLSNNNYSINKLLCMKYVMFCKFIGGETTHHRCLFSMLTSYSQLGWNFQSSLEKWRPSMFNIYYLTKDTGTKFKL